jgi:hypothetical protein
LHAELGERAEVFVVFVVVFAIFFMMDAGAGRSWQQLSTLFLSQIENHQLVIIDPSALFNDFDSSPECDSIFHCLGPVQRLLVKPDSVFVGFAI